MTDIADFTLDHYSKLLELAKAKYSFISYSEISLDQRFILWRHDCDFSLNRARRLARIEQDHQVRSTYFLNPHCEFYNLLEKEQAAIIESILACGHDIGLHFDAAFYQASSEGELDDRVAQEARWLKDWFGVEPTAFSFHNPDAFLLTCERDTYGGLINCYSRKFKDSIPYCSDSNGYWRYRRLHDVLEGGEEPRLQVLTHPGWWQDEPMHPRQRIFRSIYGRADAAMSLYDGILEKHGRDNLAGPAGHLAFLKSAGSSRFNLFDYLWNRQDLETLFAQLWQAREQQVRNLCAVFFSRAWGVQTEEIDEFFLRNLFNANGSVLFERTFGVPLSEAAGTSKEVYLRWMKVNHLLVTVSEVFPKLVLEEACIHLCNTMEALASWGNIRESVGCDGIADLDSIVSGQASDKNAAGHLLWDEFL